jgi:hypothetical protein
MMTPQQKLTCNTRFADLLATNLPQPLDKKGEPETGKVNNKGKLCKDHPVIKFLADLSH